MSHKLNIFVIKNLRESQKLKQIFTKWKSVDSAEKVSLLFILISKLSIICPDLKTSDFVRTRVGQ